MAEKIDRKKILIVDDDESVGRILGRILNRMKLDYTLAPSAMEARRLMKGNTFDLILCDIILPGESGIDLIEQVIGEYPDMAVVMVSGVEDPKIVEKALEIGVFGYIVKPFHISEVIINVTSAFKRQRLEMERRNYQRTLEQRVADRTAELQQALDSIILVIAETVERRDPYTAGHQLRTADLARAIAREMGWEEGQRNIVYLAGMIHDLGKIGVPAEILSKPTKLSNLEFRLIQVHPQTGYEILNKIPFPWPLARIIIQHHERLDGSGYPQGLTGVEMLPEARILAVADVVEAIASHRPYRPALGIEVALEEISKNKGILYDPEVVDCCLRLFRQQGYCFK